MGLLGWIANLFRSVKDKPSSSDIVPEGNIRYGEGSNLVLVSLGGLNIPFTKLPKVWIPPIPDTNSMDPSCDFGHNNILIQGCDPDNQKIMLDFIKVGDICVYRIPLGDNPYGFYALHRIVRTGADSKGRWFKFKGDNVGWLDPYTARDENIEYLCIGTIF